MNCEHLKILVIDDHALLLRGLRRLLEEQSFTKEVAEATTGSAAFARLSTFEPDIVVLDLKLGDEDGCAIAQRMLELRPKLPIIAISGSVEPGQVNAALQAGVYGYVAKEHALEELVRAIHAAMNRRLYLCPIAAAVIATDYLRMQGGAPAKSGIATLSERERQLLRLVGEGKRSKEIAVEMDVTPKSVETFRSRLMRKLGCANATELARYALREGIAKL